MKWKNKRKNVPAEVDKKVLVPDVERSRLTPRKVLAAVLRVQESGILCQLGIREV